ncbi:MULTISPECIES: cytochrome d ubiquinol oxidase subunit II [Paenibacillus]|uniref:Subunit II of cytochrome D ubiquinol oxidase n=1 Tax=Paenibacillus naphthalenovorans TaxID=162209 RepID=A0A0U2UFF2_9BACL|nr:MULTISPECIES: cytochrome d ubiquinol oxidase subunit II [Paenibacillus]ALS24969.1 subunit II of cytochrome D ubiquinol oxidase [Paenibacillus naphthalenovorans]SDJ34609.1 cytochrome d ubiquinol oxidase subunit II [Paenibacillus naphthalenovorans]
MSIEQLGITILWSFLYGYLIVGSIDFGAGFYAYYSRVSGVESVIGPVISRYLSPVWEVTNVFFVFFFVGIVGFFPETAFYYGTALLIPGSIALILLAIRGSFYAFANYGAKKNSFYLLAYGATGLLIPASLSTVFTISEGGFLTVQGNHVTLLLEELFYSAYSWAVVLLAMSSVLFISSTFLTYYAARAEDAGALEQMRRFALWGGIPTIISSLFVFIALRNHNLEHFQRTLDVWWLFGLSLISFAIAVWLIWQRRYYGVAFVMVMLQFAFAFFGYGISHLPYLLYPYLTLYGGVTNPAMGRALVVAFAAGFVLLVPSLVLLLRLFLFNARYVKGESP